MLGGHFTRVEPLEVIGLRGFRCFQIKVWHSNNKNVDQTDEEFTDFLGHKWNKVHDTFTVKKNSIVSDGSLLTRRNCLAHLTQLWDPIGLVNPATTEFTIDLQELWRAGYSWDEILPKESQTKWMENVQVLNQLLKVTVYLQGCLACKRCSACSSSCRYLNPYIRSQAAQTLNTINT